MANVIDPGTIDCVPGTLSGDIYAVFETLIGAVEIVPASTGIKRISFAIASGLVSNVVGSIIDTKYLQVTGGEIVGGDGGAGVEAPDNAEYLVGIANPDLTAERVVTNTSTVTWDLATAGQAKANVPAATTTAVGVVELATNGEDAAGVVVQGDDDRLDDDRYPLPHASSHSDGNGDPIDVKDLTGYSGNTTTFLRGDKTFATPTGITPALHALSHENGGTDEIDVTGLSGELADPQPPKAHASSHGPLGSDSLKLDDLAAPDDNTDLNATSSAHGLLPKLSSVGTQYLSGDGSWTVPPAESLGVTLVAGQLTDGRDIVLTTGDSIVGQAGGSFWFDAAGEVEIYGSTKCTLFSSLYTTGPAFVAGADPSLASSTADDFVVGGGSGSIGMSLVSSATGNANLFFSRSGSTSDGGLNYNQNTRILTFRAQNALHSRMSSAGFYPATTNSLSCGLASNRWTLGYFNGINLLESASVPGGAPAANTGVFWVGTDSRPKFQNDSDQTIDFGRMPILTLGADRALLSSTSPAVRAETTGLHPIIQFAPGVVSTTHWYDSMPWTYLGGSVMLRMLWTGTTGDATKNVRWRWRIERIAAGTVLNADGSQTITSNVAGPAVAYTTLATDLTLTNANLDALAPGEFFRVYVTRLGTDAVNDTYVAPAQLVALQIFQ